MVEKKTIKLDDVAELAGVSKTTVSRVLNNRGYLSDKTIKKVHDAMDKPKLSAKCNCSTVI